MGRDRSGVTRSRTGLYRTGVDVVCRYLNLMRLMISIVPN